MPTFRFKAINRKGNTIRGEYDAANEIDLYNYLQSVGLEVVSFKEEYFRPKLYYRSVSDADMAACCRQFYYLLRASIAPIEAIDSVRITLGGSGLRPVLISIGGDLKNGVKLASAFAKFPQLFDRFFIGMLEAGETTGRLDYAFEQLSEHFSWRHTMRRKALKALRYPVITLLFTSGIVFVALAHFYYLLVDSSWSIPAEIGPRLLATPFVLDYWLWILIGPYVALKLIRFFYSISDGFAYAWDGFVMRLPWVGTLKTQMDWAKFSLFLALLYRCGIEMISALKAAQKVVKNALLRKDIALFIEQLERKMPLMHATQATQYFPSMLVQALHQGEQTGYFDESLREVHRVFARQADDELEKIIEYLKIGCPMLGGGMLASHLLG